MLKKKLITAAVSACLLAAGQCGAQETTGRTKIAVGADEALLYRGEAAQKSVSGDMSFAGLISEEASDIYSQAEKTSAFSECRDICVSTVLDGGKMKTEEEAEEYLMRITHDFMSRMIYGRPDIFAVRSPRGIPHSLSEALKNEMSMKLLPAVVAGIISLR